MSPELQQVCRFAERVFAKPADRNRYVQRFAELRAKNPKLTAKDYGAFDESTPVSNDLGELIQSIQAIMPGVSRACLEQIPLETLQELVRNLPAPQVDAAVSTFAEKLPAAGRERFRQNVFAVRTKQGNAAALKLLR